MKLRPGSVEGDANGAPHPNPGDDATKFAGRYEQRTITGGVGHGLPQEAPDELCRAVRDVAAMTGSRSHAAR